MGYIRCEHAVYYCKDLYECNNPKYCSNKVVIPPIKKEGEKQISLCKILKKEFERIQQK